MKIFSPNNIEVLLHFHTSSTPHPRREAGAVADAITQFLHWGAIENVERDIFRTTPLGKAWVQALCNVPIPRRAFVDETNVVLGYDL